MIYLTNETKFHFSEKKLIQEVTRWLKPLGLFYQTELGEISLAFLKPSSIRKLEKQYFGKDQVTDVLTFPSEKGKLAGDIGICLVEVYQDAKSDGVEPESYLSEVILHGLLHLCGLKHTYSKKELARVTALHLEWRRKLKIKSCAFKLNER